MVKTKKLTTKAQGFSAMASFHIHADQENQISNISRLKEHGSRNSQHVTQKRSVLGILDSNTSRANNRTLKNAKGLENHGQKQKSKSIFTVHEDKISEEKPIVKKECELEHKVNEPEEKNEDTLPRTVAVIPRQPLKELKIPCAAETESEDARMSDCETIDIGSPMSVEKSVHKSPKVRESNKDFCALYNCDEYEHEIFKYLCDLEKRNRPKPFYMRRQPEVNYSMRVILVDWLIEVQEEYKMKTETLYLAVSFIDRFLSLMSVVSGKLQLLGTSAMFIAAKYEEIYPPEVHEFVYITDDTYKKSQVLRMEHLILKVLGFNLSTPTVNTFLSHIAVRCNLSEKLYHLAMFLCELTLLEGDPFLQYRPSLTASSAIAVARHCLEYSEMWPQHMIQQTGYKLTDLVTCINEINKTHARVPNIPEKAVCVKYRKPRWHCVSEIEPKPFVLNVVDSSIHSQN